MQKKNQLAYFLFFIMSVSIMGSCQAQVDRKSKKSETRTKETRNVSSFNSLDLSISANVMLKQGAGQSLILEGDAEDLEKIVTEVSGSELNIKTRPGTWNIGKITVYLTMEEIKNLKISGSGSIKSETAIKSTDLDMVISGSGNIHISDLSAERLSSVISGSGNINYSGSTPTSYSKIVVTGSGNINADGLSSNDAQVNITGSGNCKVFANEKLDVQITGSGSVQYKGKALINANVTGSGKVRQI